ncbi:hypothetical protein ACT7CY_04845 [Bacillus pacificus]
MVRAVFQKVYQRLFEYIDRNLKYIDLPTKIDKQKEAVCSKTPPLPL